jgi:serine/threonine-protein kinase
MVYVPRAGESLGRYRLEEELGRGGMAVVFRASDPTLRREVAIKIMHPHMWGNPEYAARFAREARAVAALRHPNIVEIYDFGEGEGGPDGIPGYIVSELVRGPTLREFLDRSGTPLPEVAAMIVLKLCEALEHAHASGIIHRDLKPENVMIAEGGRVVLADFGIARIVEGEAVTQTGAMMGSPAYMSPEQARGQHVDARADLFSLGTVLYQLTTGVLPFVAKDPIATVIRVLEGKYEPPLKRNPRLGSQLDRVIRRLLQPDPAARYEDAAALAAALRGLLAEAAIRDPDAELRRYFTEPGPYNRELETRIVESSLTLAEQATGSRDFARALAFCDRVLTIEPEHPRALELMSRLARRGAWRRRAPYLASLTGVALLLAGGSAWWFGRSPPPPERPPRPTVVRRVDASPRVAVVHSDLGAPRDAGLASLAPDQRAAPGKLALKRRRRDAGGVALAVRVADARAPRPDQRAAPGELLVEVGECELRVDGKPRPRGTPLALPAGRHEVSCRHASGKAEYRRSVLLRPGQRVELVGPTEMLQTEVRLSLTRGDAVRVRGQTHRTTFRAAVSKHDVELLKDGSRIDKRWISVPATGCTLVDTPALICKP